MIEITCRVFIFSGNEILLCKQKNPPRDYWTLPGGSVYEGETIIECIQREIVEELGVSIKVDQLLYIREMITDIRHRVEFYFSADVANDDFVKSQVSACSEIEAVKFILLDEVSNYIVKPECISDLATRYLNDEIFPQYLGNVR